VYGIVTAADDVRVYDQIATPFFLIGEVDQELRRLIRSRFEIEDIQPVCAAGADLQSFDDMTMGDYLAVLRNGAAGRNSAGTWTGRYSASTWTRIERSAIRSLTSTIPIRFRHLTSTGSATS
jgi:hypothetical protein